MQVNCKNLIKNNFSDNIIYSYTQIMRVMIKNDWTDPMYISMKTFHPYTLVLYILIIFIGGIFGANLIIAVLKIHYTEVMN